MPLLAAFTVPHPPLIIPAVGKGGERQIAETTAAYEHAAEEIAALRPDTIVVTSPHLLPDDDEEHAPLRASARLRCGLTKSTIRPL